MKKINNWIGAIEVVSFLLLIFQIALFSKIYDAVAENAPIAILRRSIEIGDAKTLFLILFLVGMVIYGLLFLLKRFPRLVQYPVKITPGNIDRQSKLYRLAMSILTFLAMSMVNLLMYNLYLNVSTGETRRNTFMIGVIVALMLVDMGVYILLARKNR